MSKYIIALFLISNVYGGQFDSRTPGTTVSLHMNEREGVTLVDSSGRGNNATTSATHTSGLFDYGLTRTGSNGVYIPYNTDLFMGSTGNATYGAWFYFNSIPSPNSVLMELTAQGGADDYAARVLILNSYNLQVTSICDGDGATFTYVNTAANTISLGRWTQIVVVKEGLGIKVFINGVLKGSYSIPRACTGTSSTGFCVGPSTDSCLYLNTVDLIQDDFFFMKGVALTDGQVRQLYLKGKGLYGVEDPS